MEPEKTQVEIHFAACRRTQLPTARGWRVAKDRAAISERGIGWRLHAATQAGYREARNGQPSLARRAPGVGILYDCRVLMWIHLLATGAFVGATLGLAIFTVRHARAAADLRHARARLYQVLRVYDPLAIALLGLMVMTGAWSITGLKAEMGGAYFESVGGFLAGKLVLAFFVVMSGTWIAMGIGHRIVREEEWGEDLDEGVLRSRIARLGGAAWTTVLITLATVWVSLGN